MDEKGLDKVAELVEKIAVKCAQIFDRLMGKIVSVARRFVPVLGQILMAFEWISSGFKDFPGMG